MQAFERYVTAVYAERFDKYSGERVDVVGEQPTAYRTIVKTQIVKADGEPVILNYFMVNGAGGPQIGDVYLNGHDQRALPRGALIFRRRCAPKVCPA